VGDGEAERLRHGEKGGLAKSGAIWLRGAIELHDVRAALEDLRLLAGAEKAAQSRFAHRGGHVRTIAPFEPGMKSGGPFAASDPTQQNLMKRPHACA